jgi:hypothetical protein
MKKSQNSRNKGFFYQFCLLKEPDPWIQIQEAQKHTDPERTLFLLMVSRRSAATRIFL